MSSLSVPRAGERIALGATALLVGALVASLLPTPKPAPLALADAAATPVVASDQPDQPSVPAVAASAIDSRRLRDSGLGETMKDGLIMTGVTPHRLILFTFDDGPDRRTTPLLLDRLDAAHVRAVFFLTGNRLGLDTPTLRQQSAIAREIRARGHLVASHTFDHLQLPLLSDADVTDQVERTERVFTEIFGARPWLIRPPGGGHSERIDQLLARRGYTTMLWNLGAGDFQVRSATQVLDTWRKVYGRLEAEGQRGGIVLLHDTYSWSVDAFQHIYNELRDRNCALLERGEELFDIVDDPSLFFVARGTDAPSALTPPVTLERAVLAERQARLRIETARRCRSLGDRL